MRMIKRGDGNYEGQAGCWWLVRIFHSTIRLLSRFLLESRLGCDMGRGCLFRLPLEVAYSRLSRAAQWKELHCFLCFFCFSFKKFSNFSWATSSRGRQKLCTICLMSYVLFFLSRDFDRSLQPVHMIIEYKSIFQLRYNNIVLFFYYQHALTTN